MHKDFRIVPECYIDTLIAETILKVTVNHAQGSGKVARIMTDNLKNSKAIGIIDNDSKRVPDYFSEFDLIEEKSGLQWKKHRKKEHYLIIVSPAADRWLYDSAIDLNINLTKAPYNIKNFKNFLRLTKSTKVAKNASIKNLLNTLNQKKNSPFSILKNWVNSVIKTN